MFFFLSRSFHLLKSGSIRIASVLGQLFGPPSHSHSVFFLSACDLHAMSHYSLKRALRSAFYRLAMISLASSRDQFVRSFSTNAPPCHSPPPLTNQGTRTDTRGSVVLFYLWSLRDFRPFRGRCCTFFNWISFFNFLGRRALIGASHACTWLPYVQQRALHPPQDIHGGENTPTVSRTNICRRCAKATAATRVVFNFFIVSMGLEGYCARAAIHPLVSLSLLILGFHLRTALAHILRASAERIYPELVSSSY